MNPKQQEQARTLRSEGASIRAIASAVGATTHAVRTWLHSEQAIARPPDDGGPAVVFYDIETRPKVGLYFGPNHETRIAKQLTATEVLTFSYKWEGDSETRVVSAWDDPRWRAGLLEVDQDEYVLRKLWDMYDLADVVVAHNGDAFDQKRAFGRMLKYDISPPSHFIEVDTLKLSRTFFGLDSHKLEDLARHLGLEGKKSHEGIDLWKACMLGDQKAHETMEAYNIRDTELLEEVYQRLEPWVGFNGRGRKFNRALWAEDAALACPNCGGYDLLKNGWRETATTRKQSYLCGSCGARPTERTITQKKKGVVLN